QIPRRARHDRPRHAGRARNRFQPGILAHSVDAHVLSVACTQMKMTPAEAVAAATLHAAESLGRGRHPRALQPRKLADFVVHDAADYREIPYFFGRETAKKVFIEGKLQTLS